MFYLGPGAFVLSLGTFVLVRGAFRDSLPSSNLHRRFFRVGIAADRLVFGSFRRVLHGWLIQGRLVGIVQRLVAGRRIDRLAGIAVAAGVVGVPGGGDCSFSQGKLLLACIAARIGPPS